MLPANRDRLLAEIPDGDLVLDVGGWAEPFPRADWVIDVRPYESRGLYGPAIETSSERFTAESWVVHDICNRDPWPFADERFDYVICSHTLEDVRDPVGVCRELQRVARAGYVEVPSRIAEQTWGIMGPWAGWPHHHWFCEIEDGGLVFVFKSHAVHRPGLHLPEGVWDVLSEEERVTYLFWEDTFPVREHIFEGRKDLYAWMREGIAANAHLAPPRRRSRLGRVRPRS